MSVSRIVVFVGILLVLAYSWPRANAQVFVPRPEDVRFQLLANEPVAAPDGRSTVAGWSALTLKDRRTNQCFVAFTQGSEMSALPVPC
jgi:hypothetical protein